MISIFFKKSTDMAIDFLEATNFFSSFQVENYGVSQDLQGTVRAVTGNLIQEQVQSRNVRLQILVHR